MNHHEHESCQDRWHDELAAYALGALPEPDAVELERHLGECETCSDRLLWLRPAVDLVPASVPQLEPPPELGHRLMAIVEAEAAADAEAAGATAAGGSAASPARRRPRLRLPSFGSLRPALAGIAVFAILLAGAGGYLLAGGGEESEPESFALKPLSAKVAASGEVEIADGTGTLTVNNLPAIAEDEVYQLWTARGDEVLPSSIFVPETGGHATAEIPEIPEDTERLLITREPEGGSEVASTDALLAARID